MLPHMPTLALDFVRIRCSLKVLRRRMCGESLKDRHHHFVLWCPKVVTGAVSGINTKNQCSRIKVTRANVSKLRREIVLSQDSGAAGWQIPRCGSEECATTRTHNGRRTLIAWWNHG